MAPRLPVLAPLPRPDDHALVRAARRARRAAPRSTPAGRARWRCGGGRRRPRTPPAGSQTHAGDDGRDFAPRFAPADEEGLPRRPRVRPGCGGLRTGATPRRELSDHLGGYAARQRRSRSCAWLLSPPSCSPRSSPSRRRRRAATYTVDSTGTADDAVPGNGVCRTAGGACTLRAAVREANAGAGSDRVVVPAGTYTLATTLQVQPPADARGRRGRLDLDRRRRRDRPAADRGRDQRARRHPARRLRPGRRRDLRRERRLADAGGRGRDRQRRVHRRRRDLHPGRRRGDDPPDVDHRQPRDGRVRRRHLEPGRARSDRQRRSSTTSPTVPAASATTARCACAT